MMDKISKAILSVLRNGQYMGNIIIASGIHISKSLIKKDSNEILGLKNKGVIVCIELSEQDTKEISKQYAEIVREYAALKLCKENNISIFGIDMGAKELYEKSKYFKKREYAQIAFWLAFTSILYEHFLKEKFNLGNLANKFAGYILEI